MTVQNQNVKNVYRGNGSTTVFPFTFAINESHPEYIHVYITNDGGKAAETTDFTCDMETRTITYPKVSSSAPKLSATQRLTIYRLLPYEQNLNLVNQGPFFSEDVETQLDDLEMQIQQLSENLVRCFQIGIEAQDFDMTMELEPGKVICVNSEGNGFEAREALMEVNGHWDGEGRRIESIADPAAAQDVVTKKYVDTLTDNNFMKLQPDGTAWEARNLPIGNVAGPALVKDAANKDYVDRILEGYSGQGERFKIFDNVAQMKAADLIPSQVVATQGYTDINDGGASVYTIRTKAQSDVDDGGSVIFLDNGNVAELITDGTVNVKQFGAYGDGTHDDTTAIQNAIDTKLKVFIPKGIFAVTNLNFYSGTYIEGCGFDSALKSIGSSGYILSNSTNAASKFVIKDFRIECENTDVRCFYVYRPYDDCEIRNIRTQNMKKAFLVAGNENNVSQSLVIDNCMLYSSVTVGEPEMQLKTVNEVNLKDTKFLRGVMTAEFPLVMDACRDAFVRGCSFGNCSAGAVHLTNGSVYNRFIGNTYEVISNILFVIDGGSEQNIIIETPYWNASRNVTITGSNNNMIQIPGANVTMDSTSRNNLIFSYANTISGTYENNVLTWNSAGDFNYNGLKLNKALYNVVKYASQISKTVDFSEYSLPSGSYYILVTNAGGTYHLSYSNNTVYILSTLYNDSAVTLSASGSVLTFTASSARSFYITRLA